MIALDSTTKDLEQLLSSVSIQPAINVHCMVLVSNIAFHSQGSAHSHKVEGVANINMYLVGYHSSTNVVRTTLSCSRTYDGIHAWCFTGSKMCRYQTDKGTNLTEGVYSYDDGPARGSYLVQIS